MEEWRDIKGYEGIYQVSNEGRVKSLGGERYKIIRILKGYVGRNGYRVVNLWKDGVPKLLTVHRLVAQTFIPNPDNKPCIDHINTIRTDNRVENLRWVTYIENNRNPITNKKMSDTQKLLNATKKRNKLGQFTSINGTIHKEL